MITRSEAEFILRKRAKDLENSSKYKNANIYEKALLAYSCMNKFDDEFEGLVKLDETKNEYDPQYKIKKTENNFDYKSGN